MGILLRETLRTICEGNHWSYAVVWKFGCQNSRLLIWEECYYESFPDSVHSHSANDKASLPYGGNIRLRDKLDLLMYQMVNHSQFCIVGEGIVGRAAFTGKHEWILSSDYVESRYPLEVINQLNYQFVAGIQTIAVIPFIHGVVQFGSSIPMMENVSFVNEVRHVILQLGFIPGGLFPESESSASNQKSTVLSAVSVPISAQVLDHSKLPHLIPLYNPTAMQLLSSPVLLNESHPEQSRKNHYVAPTLNISKNCLSDSLPYLSDDHHEHRSTNGTSPAPPDQNVWIKHGRIDGSSGYGHQPQVIAIPDLLTCKEEKSMLCLDDTVSCVREGAKYGFSIDIPFHTSQDCENFSLPPAKIPTVSNVLASSTTDNSKISMCSDSDCTVKESGTVKSSMPARDQFHSRPKVANTFPNDNKNSGKALSGDELNDIFGLECKTLVIDDHLNLFAASGGKDSDSPKKLREVLNQTYCSDHLLDAVVSGACSTNKLSSSDILQSTIINNAGNSSDPSSSSVCGILGITDNGSKRLHDPVQFLGKSLGSSNQDIGCCSITNSGYGSQLTSWVSSFSGKQDSSVSVGLGKRCDESIKTPRKRLKPGENPRPRPKDRQMIQDRVKELREIVPNGTKCSIDALLERTIKHMTFLQSVTKHADKLKQAGEAKLISSEGRVLFKDNFEGGKTWAYEVGSQSAFCPILVEDLNSPRQLLIEMLCEERGFFLEIADSIRSMGLTILKGIMECRNSKIWAQFAVEADRDVTRREVFISLVNLLDHLKSDMQSVDNEHMSINNCFHPATSIPATGLASVLQ